MAEDITTATPDATTGKQFKIPVRTPAPQQTKSFKVPVRGKEFSIPVRQAAAPLPPDNLATIEDNPVDPKTGKGEGTYAIKINGQVKQVPFSKVPHVAAISPMMTIGGTTFANEADERRYLHDLEYAPEEVKHRAYNASDRWDLQAQTSQEQTSKKPDPIYEPVWWTLTKASGKGVADIFLGSSGPAAVPGFAAAGITPDPQAMLEEQASKGDSQALQTIAFQREVGKTFESPLVNVSGTKTFQKVFDPTSKSGFSRGVTGFTHSVENMSSIANLYSLASIYAAPESISAPMGLRFQTDIATSGVQGIADIGQKTAAGDKGAAGEAWGEMFGNIAVITGMHYGEKSWQDFKQRDTTAILNDKSKEAYDKKFNDLTPQQKASVLYEAVEDANPRFKARVNQEVARLNAKRKGVRFTHGEGTDSEGRPLLKKVGIDPRAVPGAVMAAEPTTEEVRQQRLEAAQKLTRQIIERKAREEAYKQHTAQMEKQARAAEEQRQAAINADTIPSAEQQRGFPVEESRTTANLPVTGLRKTTEREPGQRYDPELKEPAIPVVDRRTAAIAEPSQSTAADKATVASGEVRGQTLYSIHDPDGKIQGKLDLNEVATGKFEISGVSVRIKGQGYGRKLYEETIKAENAKGHTVVSRQDGATSEEARRVWDSLVRRGLAVKVGESYEAAPHRAAKLKEANRAVQELSEQQFGQSFSSLPVYRQQVAAEWMAKNHPEQWEAFKSTPAYAQHEIDLRHAQTADAMLRRYLDRNQTGDREPLAPGADVHAGAAKLILNRSNIDAVLKADPETHRDINEHTERFFGKSFDSLDAEQRIPALAEYLRSKPEKIKAFVSIDITNRMESGQHIDLANMGAEQMARQRSELRMSQRDSIRRAVDMDLAAQVVTEQRQAHDKELSDALYASLTGRTATLEELYRVSRGITDQAGNLGLGKVNGVEDLFKIERDALALPESARTPAINEFLVRMRQVRAAAEDHVFRELAEKTAAQFRSDPETAAEDAARQIVELSGQAQDLQKAADDFRAQGQPKEAAAAQQDANFNSRKADAVAAGAESVHSPAPTPVAKPDVPMSVGRETRVVSHGNGENLPAHYVLMEAGDLRTSHLPFTYEEREGYNQKGQPRNYKASKNAQARVAQLAASPDPDQLLDNGVSATTGPPIIDQKTDVISGNRRAMGLLTAIRDNPDGYARYIAELHSRAVTFGIDPAEVLKLKNPVLVKMLDKPVDTDIEWSRLGTELNRGPEGGMSDEEQGEAMKRLLTLEFRDRLTDIVLSMDVFDKNGTALTIRELMRARSADIAQLLQDAGIISPTKIEEYVDADGNLKEKAKDLFENMLASMTVTDPEVLNRASAAVKDKLTRAGVFFAQMQSAGENWNLASMNTDAVRLLNRVQDAAARLSHLVPRETSQETSESLVDRFLHPEKYVDKKGFGPAGTFEFDGQPLIAPPHPAVEALAHAIEESPRTYSTMMANFADNATGKQSTMFGAEHPADAFTAEIGSKYGINVLPEEWGTVSGLPDAVKVSIENSRGPLPVEPSVHAETAIEDAMPDSSSVVGVLKDTPRTIADLQKALETHPSITSEQAAAVTQLFEDILPRAIGESMEDLLGNRRLNFSIGGETKESYGKYRGYMEMVNDGQAIIRLADSADTTTVIHEMAHYIRRYLKPEYQRIANEFVGAKPGEEWTDPQDEKFAEAFERYHFDGGLRRGKLEAVFATIHRAMQSIYNAVTVRGLAKGSKELNAMFDDWYDWTRAERKPVTARIDVDELESLAGGKVEIPVEAMVIERGGRPISDQAENFVFLGKDSALDFVRDRKNGVRGYEMHQVRGADTVYVRADAKKGKKLYQPGLDQMVTLARQARDLEAELKRETDPKRQALLRGRLNGIEDKLRGATGIVGADPEPRDTSVLQLVHGISEQPRIDEPTTPAQAVTVEQIHGDPTGVALGGEHGGARRTEADGSAGVREERSTGGIPEPTGKADREHGSGAGKGTAIAKPDKNPLAGVRAAKLKAPDKERGTPVVDPEKWRGHVEALGLPEGTPPPTVRIDPDLREMMIYPGQAEAIEGVLSALQQYDATVLAAPLGSGKTPMNTAIASHLLGTSGDKVGLIVTRSQNLIHEADGYIEWGHRVGLTVDPFPTDTSEVQTGGVYAATYAQLRGNRQAFSIPWDFVIFDESAEARNWTESDQGRAVVLLGHAAKKVVYSSATPYSTIMEMGYMHKLGLWPKGGFAEWAGQFGLREVAPNTYSGGTSAKRLTKLRQQLIERGQWQTLYKDMDGVQGHVALIPQTDEVRAGVRSIRTAFAKAAKAFQKAGLSRYLTPTLGHEAIYLKRYIAGTKVPQAIELGKKLISDGWNPIFFTEYRSPAEEGMEFFHNLPGDLGAEINKLLPPLPDVVGMMREAFGDKVGIFAGEANQLRAGELEAFQSGEKDAIYMTYGAGAVGANAQDKVGDRPRAAVFIDLPWGGMMFEQGTGRPWRYGSKSNVAMFFLTSDALPEMKLLATKILPRMRSLKAAVYGEKIESQLAKNLREAVGIPEEVLEYDEGQEVKPQAAEWEEKGEGANYTKIEDLELPDADKAKNKGMKYKGAGRKLFQGPKDQDPFEDLARAAWEGILERTKSLPAPEARSVTANEAIVKPEIAEAGQRAMGSGEPVDRVVKRKTMDFLNDTQLSDKALLAAYRGKGSIRALYRFVQETAWNSMTSGDKVVEKIFRRAGMEKQGIEIKRRMIDFDMRKGLYQGRMQAVIREIVNGNKLTPPDIEMMSRVVEGQAKTDNPRINKAAKEFRAFTADVRRALGDAGSAVVIYEGGLRREIPYSAIENDPHYWPRMYDWQKPFVITDKVTGKKEVHSLAEIMNMPTSDERREKIIDKFAEERGISKVQARQFFERNDRGIRLAGNVERAREWSIPTYGRDRQAIERYIDQVATTLAATEVHGQFRQKTDPIISQLPPAEASLAHRIVTYDLDPAHLPEADRAALSASSAIIITGKMFYSPIKVLTHLWKASLATNTRSLVGGLFAGIKNPTELFERARDCNALLDYSKSLWMREYGMRRGNIGQKFLDFTGFSFEVQASRILSSAMGRHWFEKYAYPELVKNPQNESLRRKLTDLYGMSDEQMDNIVKNGYGPDDVRRMELGAANWVTGSNRPSEMPPMFRPKKDADPLEFHLSTLFRSTQMLHGFMFKTANLVKRTVFDELYRSNWKSIEPYHLVGRFAFNAGLAGFALEQLLTVRHKLQHSTEADIEKHRHEWLEQHPASAEALWWSLANMSMAVGVQPLTDLFNELGTRNPKDREKLATQHRFAKGVMGMPLGIPGQDADAIFTATEDLANSFSDTGRHKLSPEERRANIIKRLIGQEVVGSTLIPGMKPTPVKPTSHPRRHVKSVLQ